MQEGENIEVEEEEGDDVAVIEPVPESKITKFKLKECVIVNGKNNYERTFTSVLLEEYGSAIEIYKWQTLTKDWLLNKKERVQKQLKKPL